MEFHPLANAFPLLAGEAFAELVESVKLHGVKVACWKYEGKILDGRNRWRAAQEAGVPVLKWENFEGTNEEALELVRLLNDIRRHGSREERREWVAALRAQGLSTRAIADVVGVAQMTVVRDLRTQGESCDSPATSPAAELPERLAKVHDLKAIGKTDKEVAEELDVSTKTVQRAKVDITKRQQAAPRVQGKDNKMHPASRPKMRSRKTAPAPAPHRRESVELKPLIDQLAALTDSLTNGRNFWAGAKTLEDGKRWELADRLEALAKAMYRRATELRNK